MAWQQPKTNWDTHPKAIEPADLNRIEGNIEVVREQIAIPLRLEVVSSFPAHMTGRAIYHTGDRAAYISDGTNWVALGGEGNAGEEHVLAGKTFSSRVAGVEAVGSMPNRGAVIITPGTSNKTIDQGYHNGLGYVEGDINLDGDNIKKGVSIFGVEGNLDFQLREASDTVRLSAPTERTVTLSEYSKIFRVKGMGTYKLIWESRIDAGGWDGYVWVETSSPSYKWDSRFSNTSWEENSRTVTCYPGSTITLRMRAPSASQRSYMRNVRLCFDTVLTSTLYANDQVVQD